MLCNECHVVPGPTYAAGHIDGTPGAEVVMNNELARTVTNKPGTPNHTPSLPLFTPNPVYNPTTFTCASSYCHGNFKNGNTNFAPVWNDPGGSQMACGTCHGDVTRPTQLLRALPKTSAEGGSHPAIPQGWTCANCHGTVVNANTQIINPAKHINGKLNIGDAEIEF
jgi:predicted CxxxxCH...CXXCH cytochrome family protein